MVAAWLVFYVEAQRSPAAGRLLSIYSRRLHSNLVHELRQLVRLEQAVMIARGAAAMIDGIYIRSALYTQADDTLDAGQLVADYLDVMVAQGRRYQ